MFLPAQLKVVLWSPSTGRQVYMSNWRLYFEVHQQADKFTWAIEGCTLKSINRQTSLHEQLRSLFNPFPPVDDIWQLWSRRLLKTLCQKKKLIMMSNFSFWHSAINTLFIILSFNPFPHIDAFWCLCGFLKTWQQKEKLLKTMNFSFCHHVFNSIQLL